MQILIVDDEQLARQRLVRLLEDIEDCDVIGEAANGMEAVAQAESLKPDLVLLDIRMPGMDGLEAATHINQMEDPPAVIFCTAYEEHAIQAFEVSAVGYLLKPVRRRNLAEAITKAQRVNRAQIQSLAPDDESRARSHISARTHKGIELIPVDNVLCFQADHKYVTVLHEEGELLIDESLKDLESEFGDKFMRVHRNALVATRAVGGLEKHPTGHFQVVLKGSDRRVDVSRRHASAVRKAIQNL